MRKTDNPQYSIEDFKKISPIYLNAKLLQPYIDKIFDIVENITVFQKSVNCIVEERKYTNQSKAEFTIKIDQAKEARKNCVIATVVLRNSGITIKIKNSYHGVINDFTEDSYLLTLNRDLETRIMRLVLGIP